MTIEKRNPWFVNALYNGRRLNQAADELTQLNESAATTDEKLLHLLALDREQQHEISKLQSVVYVLMQMLTEKNAIDGADMDARIKASFTQLESDPEWKRMRGT